MALDEDGAVLAAELMLGLLEGEARAAALRRVLAEPDFAREVEAWRDRFDGLFAGYSEIAPPAEIAQRIEDTLAEPRRRGGGRATIVALASMLAAACLVIAVLLRPEPPVPVSVQPLQPPPLIAALAPTDGHAPVAALYDAGKGEVRVMAASFAPKGKSAELWVIATGEQPRSLGLLHNGQPTTLTPAPDRRGKLAAGVTLAVSIEPVAGSPTGLPTGPVVATGALATS